MNNNCIHNTGNYCSQTGIPIEECHITTCYFHGMYKEPTEKYCYESKSSLNVMNESK